MSRADSLIASLGVSLLVAGCAIDPGASRIVVRETGFAQIVMPAEEPFTGRRLIGPEDIGSNGWLHREKSFDLGTGRKDAEQRNKFCQI